MAGWAHAHSSSKLYCGAAASEVNEVMIGALLSQKISGVDLMQNCDLPPPLKVFTRSDKAVVSPASRICGMMGPNPDFHKGELNLNVCGYGDDRDEKLELLKALRLSQTRAREAERKAASSVEDRDRIANALLQESMQLFAHRQWVRLLEIQVSNLQSQWLKREKHRRWFCAAGCDNNQSKEFLRKATEGEDRGGEPGVAGPSWSSVALAICLGMAGVGFVFGCSRIFF